MADPVFVVRTGGVVTSVYANAQPGYATEQLSDTDPEVVAFLAAPQIAAATERARKDVLISDGSRAALLTTLKNATPAQIDNYINNNVTTLAQVRTAIATILKLIAVDLRQ